MRKERKGRRRPGVEGYGENGRRQNGQRLMVGAPANRGGGGGVGRRGGSPTPQDLKINRTENWVEKKKKRAGGGKEKMEPERKGKKGRSRTGGGAGKERG